MARRVWMLLALFALAVSTSAWAQAPVNTNGTPYALGGYDVVAYFSDKQPIKGATQYAARYRGATWLFASALHKQRFAQAPETFVPAYLGYCAYGVAQNRLVAIDPQAWTVLDGRLYLNYSLAIRARWSQATASYIAQANRNWPGLMR